MTKPIIAIKQKCRECSSYSYRHDIHNPLCKCKGTGEHEMKITPLRDFEKCEEKWHKEFNGIYGKVKCWKCGFIRDETGYIIPKEYEPYEIKKVSEIIFTEEQYASCQEFWFKCKEHLKEDDKVVIT